MSIWKCFQMAMSSIVGNKMRSILTMLGIIIGITAVIALVSLMSGMTSEITDRHLKKWVLNHQCFNSRPFRDKGSKA